jgi:hypothetical protein
LQKLSKIPKSSGRYFYRDLHFRHSVASKYIKPKFKQSMPEKQGAADRHRLQRQRHIQEMRETLALKAAEERLEQRRQARERRRLEEEERKRRELRILSTFVY